MSQKVAWVEHAAGIRGKGRGQRSHKWVWMRLSTPISIREAEALSEPEALVTSYERFTTDRAPRQKETVRRATPGHDGSLWRPLQDGEGRPLTAAGLANLEASRRAKFWPVPKPYSRYGELLLPEADVMMAITALDVDGRPLQRARVGRVAESLCEFAGVLWRKDPEPSWVIGLDGGRAVLDYARGLSSKEIPGLRVRIDQRDEAEAIARALGTAKKPKLSKMRVEKADAQFLSLEAVPATIQAMTNAVWAIRREARINGCGHTGTMEADAALQEAWVYGADWTGVASKLQAFAEVVASDVRNDYHNRHRTDFFDVRASGYGWANVIETSVAAGLFPRHVGETLVACQDTDESIADLGF
ncbi:hypothetical protein [Bosea sp. RAC05]|uniref:hypothetical protein n=1 Tax=Bosea sp. RAC05 TaxID=1842539 RepID=UPI00085862C6|nr:hypothetical protein [Bosea sp. RAC05]AOG03347.1 hypothetical protein BSY19_4811 [Bosea sp. RAC05]